MLTSTSHRTVCIPQLHLFLEWFKLVVCHFKEESFTSLKFPTMDFLDLKCQTIRHLPDRNPIPKKIMLFRFKKLRCSQHFQRQGVSRQGLARLFVWRQSMYAMFLQSTNSFCKIEMHHTSNLFYFRSLVPTQA